MCKVQSKDIIGKEILPYLSIEKRGFETKICLLHVVFDRRFLRQKTVCCNNRYHICEEICKGSVS